MKREKLALLPVHATALILLLGFFVPQMRADSKSGKYGYPVIVDSIRTFESAEEFDKSTVSKDLIFRERLKRIDELSKQLDDMQSHDEKRFEEVLLGAVDLIRRKDSPEEILERIESRIDQMVERLVNEYSQNSGQNDRLDNAAQQGHDPFVNTIAEFWARSQQLAESLGNPNPVQAGGDPLVSREPGEGHDLSTDAGFFQAMLEVTRARRDQAKADLDYALDLWRWDESKSGYYDEAAENLKRVEDSVTFWNDMLNAAIETNNRELENGGTDTGLEEMRHPDQISPDEIEEAIAFWIAFTGKLGPKVTGHRDFGLINPGEDNQRIDSIPRNDTPGAPLDIYINPGAENFENEAQNIPDEFAPLPHIDGFGGAVDPIGPKTISVSGGSKSSSKGD